MEIETRTIKEVTVASNDKIKARLVELNKKCAKLDIPEISISFGPVYKAAFECPPDIVHMWVNDIEVTGPFHIAYGGWQFAAVINNLRTGESLVKNILNKNIPEKYRTSGTKCEHCNVNRYRVDTYVLYNEKEDKFIQVGSSCMKDFLGHPSPEKLIEQAQFASIISKMIDEDFRGEFSKRNERAFDIHAVLCETIYQINLNGWTPKSKSLDGYNCTATDVWRQLLNGGNEYSDEIESQAASAIEWAESLSDDECASREYLHNIRAIARCYYVELKAIGYACSIVMAHKATQKKEEVDITNSKYVGNIKDKIERGMKCYKIIPLSTMYGVSFLCKFHDNEGNVFVWKSSNAPDFVEGGKYSVYGTIKAHSEYGGIKQTMITRCVVR